MLAEIYIRNFAIIDDLHLRFAPGFNVLTGETGAGKSIILDAVTLVIGERADTSVIRAGSNEAYVEAIFELTPGQQELVAPILLAEGLDDEQSDTLILARELRTNGRSICRVNGRSVNLTVLREIAEPLIDIHGQGEHLSLLRPRSHLPLLDAYGGLTAERRELAREVGKLRAIQHELHSLRQSKEQIAQRIELLEYKVQEIGSAGLQPDEEETLRTERTQLANAEQLGHFAAEVVALLSGVDDDQPSTGSLLGQAEHALGQLVRLDASRESLLESLQGLNFQLSEIAGDVQDYLDSLEVNADRLNAVEERLEAIGFLKRKYSADTIATLLEARNSAEAELATLQNSEVRTGELEAEQETYLRRIGKIAGELSRKRQEVALVLAQAVESHLADLRMDGARFAVNFERVPDEEGCYITDSSGEVQRVAFDQTGIDQAEFVISANPGEPLKPMAKVASGGETARLMLSLKTALAEVDQTPTLIFDEIDQGIGGRVGDIVGRKLWSLASVANHQVIVVTHLPQLAGYGDTHYHVSKAVADGRTITAVESLDVRGRVRELGEMLGTQGDSARDGAEAILRQVSVVKAEARQPQ
ncbi:MAG: DNA repair protein RecN [Chloroflexota bacterium]